MNDSLRPLWAARSIAVVGASERPGALGRLPIEFLQRHGYAGALYPVRPDGADVLGLHSYPRVQDCPGTDHEDGRVELAMIMLSADRVLGAVEDCVAAGVPVAIICSSGFAETGPTGQALQEQVVAAAGAGGLRLVGPNTIGTVGVAARQVTSFSPLFAGRETALVDGPLGFVSQSGALGYGAVSLAYERGLGLGWVVNTGNEADVGALEVMEALAAEPGCRGLLAYVESLTDIGRLRAVAASGLPVAVLKAGRSDAGQRAAASHTGALAAGDRVIDAALRQYGIVRAGDVDELLDIGDAFAQPRRPAGPRVAVVTTSGGSGILAADAVADHGQHGPLGQHGQHGQHGLQLAELAGSTRAALDEIVPAFGATANPVDVTATVMSDPDLFDRALDVLVADEHVDIVIACFCVLTGSDVDGVVESLARVAQRSGKPVLAARTGAAHLAPTAARQLREAGVPAYPTPARAVRAAAALHQATTSTTTSTTSTTSTTATSGVGNGPSEAVDTSLCDSSAAASGAERGMSPETMHCPSSGAVHSVGTPAPGARLRGTAATGERLPGTAAPGERLQGTVPAPRPDAGEQELKELLAGAGLPVPDGRLAADAREAREVVEDVGGRAVMKAVVPGMAHKTEAGGVALGVTPDTAAGTWTRLSGLGGTVLVEEMVETGGVETLVGVAHSPLGPVLTVGPGGVLTELLDDVALRLLPVDTATVEAMLDETRLGRLLGGLRGAEPADRDALVHTIVAVADVVADWPAGFELDLNPVTVLPRGRGVRILDAAYIAGGR